MAIKHCAKVNVPLIFLNLSRLICILYNLYTLALFNLNQVLTFVKDYQQIRETLPPVDLSQSTIDYMNRFDHRMFDYKTPPLNMHLQIFQDRTLFFISIHHMLCDAISIEVTVNELEELYLADSDEVVEINEGPS